MASWENDPIVGAPSQPAAMAWDNDPISTPATATQEPYAQGYTAQGLSGINEGIASTLGFPVDVANMGIGAALGGINSLTGSNFQTSQSPFLGSQFIQGMMGPAISPPTTDPGKQFLRRTGKEVGAALVPTSGMMSQSINPLRLAIEQGAIALGSGAGGAAAQQLAPDNPYAELAGQILGGGAAAAGVKGINKLITPNPISAERAAMNDTLAKEGIDLSAGQKTGNKNLQYMEAELGGNDVANLNDTQKEQFTRAALSKAGVSGNRASPDVLDKAFTDIGKQFDDMSGRYALIPDKALSDDLSASVRDYNSLVNPSQRAPVVNNTLNDLVTSIRQNGQVSGEAYKSIRSRLATAARKTSDPELKGALQDIYSSLDDAMERSIAKLNPDDVGAWKQIRGDYRNLMVIENAASKAGEDAAMGLISPANLRNAAAQQGKRAYIRGQGDYADLARAGVANMTPLPQSGTAPRLAAKNIAMGLPSLLGSGLGAGLGGVPGAIGGAMAGAAVPAVAGKALMSGPGQAYLTNQLLGSGPSLSQSLSSPIIAALANQTADRAKNPNAVAQALMRVRGLN